MAIATRGHPFSNDGFGITTGIAFGPFRVDICGINEITTSFCKSVVNTKISGLIDGAPDNLNTLNELAQALNDDPNAAAAVNTALANRYTKAETDTLLSNIPMAHVTDLPVTLIHMINDASTNQQNITALQFQMTTKANVSDVNTALQAKANTSDVSTALQAKANTSDITALQTRVTNLKADEISAVDPKSLATTSAQMVLGVMGEGVAVDVAELFVEQKRDGSRALLVVALLNLQLLLLLRCQLLTKQTQQQVYLWDVNT